MFPPRIRATNTDLQTVQDNLIGSIEQLIKQQILDGVLLESVAIGTTPTTVSHKLSRIPQGYIVVSKNGPGDIYDLQRDSKTITLQSTVAVTTKIWVF
jgi:hypothetical protein